MSWPDFSRELAFIAQGLTVCGMDEAGRGPWAGPVVAAAVILDPDSIPAGLNDSKKLSEAKREMLFPLITATAQVGIGEASAAEIDALNILGATHLAMQRALHGLAVRPDLALIDGNRAPPLSIPCQTLVRGDGKSLSIAAASIVAKVTRDRIMRQQDARHPGYGFSSHKGYGTATHASALALLGPCPEHRRSFAPVRALMDSQERR
jgi:ribonuclease HII